MVDKDGKKSTKTATYTYDLLGRIQKETKTGSEDISYTYDSNNNRKEMTVGNKVTAYKYNKNDELLRTDTLNANTEEDSVVIYKNDKNGNQLATVNRYEIPSEKKDETYIDIDVTLGDNRLNENVVNHYNAENQLIQTLTKNYKVSFTYDAEGLRTGKTVNGEKTVFVWDGDQLVMELSDSGKVKKRYVRGHDLVYSDKGTEKEKHKQYPYEFIESALKKISDLDRQGKKNIIWYIADNGWTKEEKKKIRQNCRYYTNLVKTHFFVNKKSIIKEFNKKRKKNKVNSITFFCHGQDNKLKLGYDYEKSPSELELNIRDIKKIKPKRGLFWDVNTWFYSCNTATDGKKSFAYKWFKRVGGTVIAYKNYTDYAGINDNGAGIVEKIVLRLLGAGRYHPQQSINYPTCDIDDLVEYKVPRYSPVRK